VDVVVSFCYHDLPWLEAYVEGLQKLSVPVSNATIYSKLQVPAASSRRRRSPKRGEPRGARAWWS
jgi:hypothetical protein